ncbi:hypothetical protein LXL04_029613 [Taraxacum kok-saghyz]
MLLKSETDTDNRFPFLPPFLPPLPVIDFFFLGRSVNACFTIGSLPAIDLLRSIIWIGRTSSDTAANREHQAERQTPKTLHQRAADEQQNTINRSLETSHKTPPRGPIAQKQQQKDQKRSKRGTKTNSSPSTKSPRTTPQG